jgi:hypothetical protein
MCGEEGRERDVCGEEGRERGVCGGRGGCGGEGEGYVWGEPCVGRRDVCGEKGRERDVCGKGDVCGEGREMCMSNKSQCQFRLQQPCCQKW